MNVTDIIAVVLIAAIAALWLAAEHIGNRRRAALAEEARIVGGLVAINGQSNTELPPWRTAPWATGTSELPVVGAQPACGCGGRRCRAHREGRDCRWDGVTEPTAYAAGHPLPRDGRHSTVAVAVRWLVGEAQWQTGETPIGERLRLARLLGAFRPPTALAGPYRRLP